MGDRTEEDVATLPLPTSTLVGLASPPDAAGGAASGEWSARRAYMTDEELSLVRAAAGGDREAFRQLFARHRADVHRLVYRMIGPRSDIDDVVQEVFFQVFRSLKDFRAQSKLTTWLHRVTVNVVLMYRRAERSRPTYVEEQPSDLSEDDRNPQPDEEAERNERVRAFRRLLDRLADKKRVVFVLHELEGMSPQEISEVVGAPVLTVRTRLFYARRELEAMMGEEPALAGVGGFGGKAER